jgi:hypothetical protein
MGHILTDPDFKADYLAQFKPISKAVSMPALVLGIDIDSATPEILEGNSGTGIQHYKMETGGNLQNIHYITGTILCTTDAMEHTMSAIDDLFGNSKSNNPSLDILTLYDKMLYRRSGLRCQYSYNKFEENLYPVDIKYGMDINRVLSNRVLPDDLSSLLFIPNRLDKLFFKQREWSLYIVYAHS